jgi:D-alanyl-D-alanine carboxypeptidase/D-alanyl-D-alanine-endopeptidase (penicillin-binding protein 4)
VARRDARHGARLALWLPVLLVLAVLASAGGAYWLDRDQPDPGNDPAAVAPPVELTLPALSRPVPVTEPAMGALDPTKVRRAVAPLLDDTDLGPHVLATISGLDGTLLYSTGMGTATPASTLKLLTTTAALETLGPSHTFATTVVSDAPGRIVLVGGGDPLLASRPAGRTAYPHLADVVTLARTTAEVLEESGRTRVRLGYDPSLFSGPEVSPHWPASYISEGVVSPVSALWVDEGRPADDGLGRVDDPSAAAATAFATALDHAGVEVVGLPQERAAAPDAAELARVTSPPLSQIVEHTLELSDNEAAEVLLRHVGLATGDEGSFAAGSRGALEVLDTLGIPTDGARQYDGSGLSRDDLLDPDTLSALLQTAAAVGHPELRAVVTGLPVAGFNGSLAERFEGEELGRGAVRAKTGTLSGVSGLAGTVTDRDGNPMVFALLADRVELVDTLDARDALDAVTSALAGCRCGA